MINAERGAQPTDAAAPGAGTMPSPNSSSCKASTRNGSRHCSKTFKRALPARHCKSIVDLDLDELDRRRATAPLRARLRRRYRCCLIGCAAYAQITSVQRAPRHGRHQSECPARRHRNTHIGLAQLGESAPAALSGPLGARLGGAVTSANLEPSQK
jgi:hypothetical protein